MRSFWRAALVAAALFPAGQIASAQTALTTTVSTNSLPSGYVGNLSVLNDGIYPPNGQNYQTGTVSNYSSDTWFKWAFSGLVSVGSFNLTVDNNDNYTVIFYNGTTQVATRTVLGTDGSVSGGVETFSSNASLLGTYLPSLSLTTPVLADSARIYSSGGDGLFSIGVARFFTAAAAGVPEPATWAMMIMGFGLIGASLRRRGAATVRFA